MDHKRTKAPGLNSLPFFQCFLHCIEDKINDEFGVPSKYFLVF